MKINIQKIQRQKPIKELIEFSIINIDKPSGMTSFEVAETVKKIFGARKTGHFGTLDPKVTGVLPVAINRACKLTNFFMKKDKVYIGKMYLHSEIDEKKLKEEMKKFVGRIMQKPPVKSRVKRELRERKVSRFEVIKKYGRKVEFIADVEAGTYIRKLISDLGENIGGAHMIELRRIKAGIFEEKASFRLEKIKQAFELWKEKKDESELRSILIPAEIISEIIPVVSIKKNSLKQILTGKPLMNEDVKGKLPDSDLFCVFSEDRFIEVARKVDEKEIIGRSEFVLN